MPAVLEMPDADAAIRESAAAVGVDGAEGAAHLGERESDESPGAFRVYDMGAP
jgi:hypothetical protein